METTKKVCLLTGASGTLGTTFCRMYADQYHIIAVVRQRLVPVPTQNQRFVDPLQPTTEFPENTHLVYTVQADLTSDAEIARLIEVSLARFERIDLLVNAAAYSVWASMVESSSLLESMEAQFRVNTVLPLKLAAFIARKFWRDRDLENAHFNRGVINISSTAG